MTRDIVLTFVTDISVAVNNIAISYEKKNLNGFWQVKDNLEAIKTRFIVFV